MKRFPLFCSLAVPPISVMGTQLPLKARLFPTTNSGSGVCDVATNELNLKNVIMGQNEAPPLDVSFLLLVVWLRCALPYRKDAACLIAIKSESE